MACEALTRRAVHTLPVAVRLVASIVFLSVGVIGAVEAANAAAAPGFGFPSVGIAFVDPPGTGAKGPVFDFQAAVPGMKAQPAVIALRNTGAVYESFSLLVTLRSERGGLGRLLLAVVRDRTTGALAYRGPLSSLYVSRRRPLAPGALVAYVVTVTWPTGGREPQGAASVSFDLIAHAVAA